jgi:hypothetical protein
MQTLQQLHVSTYYKYDSLVHNLYTPIINPVVVDAISCDGRTKPPVTTQRQTGRPKVKRFRQRSELVEPFSVKNIMFILWGAWSAPCENM